ncbi:hypothetical protein [Anabaena subtropica]|uniref:Uncharacterized protein n=1 Tax=Anabaena subtropica FACHB-260 TaxID=2692884 RepID=A0ABR8CMC4_9NOST|nr:hypothetical protein [Anabaena subtropica]MBD2344386.1 hypothetical protein [Anabaena subtropica FACHB-260]
MICCDISNVRILVAGLLGIYITGYGLARIYSLQMVEHYPTKFDPEYQGKVRQDYIAKRDSQPGEGWEYQLFLPAIKTEEAIINIINILVYQ